MEQNKIFSRVGLSILFSATIAILFLANLSLVSAANDYNLVFKFSPENLVAHDNPFVEVPESSYFKLTVEVYDKATNQLAKDVNVQLSVTHDKNSLLLPSGFPWVEGTTLLVQETFTKEGKLTVSKFLFPLRGTYKIKATAVSKDGKSGELNTSIYAKQPGFQIRNWALFHGAILLVGLIIGLVYGKSLRKQGKANLSIFLMGALLVSIVILLLPGVIAHEGEEAEEEPHKIELVDKQVEVRTNPEIPDIGTPTQFNFLFKDEKTGKLLDNVKVRFKYENQEEKFMVIDTEFVSETGNAALIYGIFDGAPHKLTLDVEPTDASSTKFEPIHREYDGIMAIVHNPPRTTQFVALFIMIMAWLIGLTIGAVLKRTFYN